MKVGINLPQGSMGELRGIPPGRIASVVRDFVGEAEGVGFDSLWASDHFLPIRPGDRGGLLESWTLLSAVAASTSEVLVGFLVSCVAFRNPALLAKMGATLDVMSGGRLILGLGAGWHQSEFDAFGYEFESPQERLDRLREAAEVVRLIWGGSRVAYEGRRYRFSAPACEPRPVQEPPPLLIGGAGKLTTRIASRLADIVNYTGPPERYTSASAELDRCCEATGRDPASVERSWMTIGLHCAETEAEARRDLEAWRDAGDERYVRCSVSGSPAQVIEKLAVYADLGCQHVIVTLSDSPQRRAVRFFGETVLPQLKRLG